ncbi:exopolysaccharide production protein ExoZ [Chryseobacterium sp. SORGH_AS 447]|uniref:acyltransferase family protein n=1 Tax=Chryseobacterium sp. SORGH_AS_0447 TaxID=3041769 RepID=UPI002783DA35|nr:acyltransferase [Chryseobacterium sp. SORGH_AS_0447]MDQ1159704.1 exopolysaccharide production protein ExoZ [Chryseobacterium sp. SORGH_AS_0447]
MKLNNLQTLRAISALLVCCFHFRDYLNFQDLKLGDFLFKKGSIGVPIFFVISGFIMVYTTKKMEFKGNMLKQILIFYKRRIVRIVPLYYLLTFLWMAMGGSLLLYFTDKDLYSRLIHSLLFIPQKNVFPILYLGWSLNYEIFFYLVFGLSLFFRQYRYFFIIIFFIIMIILGKVFQFESGYANMITSSLNLYFIIGIVFSLLLEKFSVPKKWAIPLSITGIFCFVLYLLDFISTDHELLILLIVGLFVFSFLLFDYTFHFKGKKNFVFLGDISYSLYLSHPFVEIFLRRFKVDGYLNIPYFVLKIISVIILAAFLYHFVEKKITEYLKQKLKV